MFNIKDHRWLVVRDAAEAYSDTDREQWMAAFGADELRLVASTSSGNLLLVHFPRDTVNLVTLNSAFGAGVSAVLKGDPVGAIPGSYAQNVPVPLYAFEYLTAESGPY